MVNLKVFIGLLWFFVMAQIICNFWGGRTMYENADITAVSDYTTASYSTSGSADPAGSDITWAEIPSGFLGFCGRFFAFDYPIFKESDGETANDFVVLRYLLICIGIIMWIELALLLRRIATGSG